MKPKILFIIDRPRWAYETIARGVLGELSKEYDFKIGHACDIGFINKNHSSWDLIISIGWKWPKQDIRTPRSKTVGTIQSHRTLEGKDLDYWTEYLNSRYCAVGTSNGDLYKMFSGRIENLFQTVSGVDARKFAPEYEASENNLILGWAGCGSRVFRGVDLIEEAAEKAGWVVKLQDADLYKLPPNKMPGFYHSLDCYVNASESEGGSLTSLEACSCGLPLIATSTGTAKKLVQDGATGYFIERNVESIVGALNKLNKMQCRVLGTNMRLKVLDEWTWHKKAEEYRKMIECGLNHG